MRAAEARFSVIFPVPQFAFGLGYLDAKLIELEMITDAYGASLRVKTQTHPSRIPTSLQLDLRKLRSLAGRSTHYKKGNLALAVLQFLGWQPVQRRWENCMARKLKFPKSKPNIEKIRTVLENYLRETCINLDGQNREWIEAVHLFRSLRSNPTDIALQASTVAKAKNGDRAAQYALAGFLSIKIGRSVDVSHDLQEYSTEIFAASISTFSRKSVVERDQIIAGAVAIGVFLGLKPTKNRASYGKSSSSSLVAELLGEIRIPKVVLIDGEIHFDQEVWIGMDPISAEGVEKIWQKQAAAGVTFDVRMYDVLGSERRTTLLLSTCCGGTLNLLEIPNATTLIERSTRNQGH